MSDATAADPAVGLGQIQAADPAFDLELFRRQAIETYLAVKEAVEERDLRSVADQLSSRVSDELRDDINSLVARGAIQHYDGLAPTEIVVEAAQRGPQGDAITLRIKAVAMQYLSGEDDDRSPGAAGFGAFTEFWTFSRPQGAGTVQEQRSECPVCGAPIDIDTGRICHYCKTLLPSPHMQTGWVVADIRPATQRFD